MSCRELLSNLFVTQLAIIRMLMTVASDFEALLLNGLHKLRMALAPWGREEERCLLYILILQNLQDRRRPFIPPTDIEGQGDDFFLGGDTINSCRTALLRKNGNMVLFHIDNSCCEQGRGKNKEKPFDLLPVQDIEEIVHEFVAPLVMRLKFDPLVLMYARTFLLYDLGLGGFMEMLSLRQFVQDLSRYRKMLVLSFILFTAGIVLGAAGSDTIAALVAPDLAKLQEYSRELEQAPIPELSFFMFIFINNAVKSVAVIVLGGLLGMIPAIFLLMNGMVLGLLVSIAAGQGVDLFDLIVKGLLPHGIIEIPAILIASAYGLQFGYLGLKSLGELGARDRGERTVNWRSFMTSAGRGVFWIVVFLLVAAVIESTITYHLVR